VLSLARVRAGLLSVRSGGASSSRTDALLGNKTGAGVITRPYGLVASASNETKGRQYMRFISRSAFAVLVAVFAMSAVGVASASAALPEFVPASGEKFPITVEFNGYTTGSYFESTGGAKWPGCSGLKAKGEITSTKATSLTVEVKGCKQGITECNTVGAGKETEVFSGTGSLVYIKKATIQVGTVLKLTEAEIRCGKLPIKIRGSVVIPVTPINIKTSTLDLTIHKSAKIGVQEFTEYENENGEKKGAYLELNAGSGFLQACWAVGGIVGMSTSKPLTISA
jgi:hypothetical protein